MENRNKLAARELQDLLAYLTSARLRRDAAMQVVKDQVAECSAQGRLTTNGQQPGWSEYEVSEGHLSGAREKLEAYLVTYTGGKEEAA